MNRKRLGGGDGDGVVYGFDFYGFFNVGERKGKERKGKEKIYSVLCHVQKCLLLLVNRITSVRSESLPFSNLVIPLNPGKNRSSVENTKSSAEDEKER